MDRSFQFSKDDKHSGFSASSSEGRDGGVGEQRRRELADFLRTRREKLKPEQVGLIQGARRRTRGCGNDLVHMA